MKLSILLIVASIVSCQSAFGAGDEASKPTTIVFTATDGSGGPVPFETWRREGDKTVRISAKAISQFTFNEDHCALTVSFTVVPVSKSLWTFVGDDWRPCYTGQDFAFHFGPNIPGGTPFKTAVVAYALASDSEQGLDWLNQDPTLKPGVEVLKSLADDGDFGSLSYVSNEMSIALTKQGRTTQAKYFKVLALSSGLDGITHGTIEQDLSEGGLPSVPAYWSSADSESLLYSDAAKQAIEQYQATVGLSETGRLDWPTVRSTSILAASDIDALESLKRMAIEPIRY